jgi:hypothetical protein
MPAEDVSPTDPTRERLAPPQEASQKVVDLDMFILLGSSITSIDDSGAAVLPMIRSEASSRTPRRAGAELEEG